MGVAQELLVAVCGLVGALGVALVVVPTRQARLRRWLQHSGAEHEDSAVLAVQAALSRGGIAAGAVMLVLFLAFLALGLKAVGLALALVLAALLVTFLPVGGGARRRASLTGAVAVAGTSDLLLVVAGLVIAAGLMWVQGAAFHPGEAVSGLAVDASSVLPELAVYTLPVLSAVAAVVPLIAGAAHLVIARRPGLSGATGGVDVLVRRHQIQLALRAGVAVELVLAGALVRFLPLVLTQPTSDVYGGGLTQGAGLLALLLVAAALAVLVRGASLPAPRRTAALEPAATR